MWCIFIIGQYVSIQENPLEMAILGKKEHQFASSGYQSAWINWLRKLWKGMEVYLRAGPEGRPWNA